jgi:hypothetical protein
VAVGSARDAFILVVTGTRTRWIDFTRRQSPVLASSQIHRAGALVELEDARAARETDKGPPAYFTYKTEFRPSHEEYRPMISPALSTPFAADPASAD